MIIYPHYMLYICIYIYICVCTCTLWPMVKATCISHWPILAGFAVACKVNSYLHVCIYIAILEKIEYADSTNPHQNQNIIKKTSWKCKMNYLGVSKRLVIPYYRWREQGFGTYNTPSWLGLQNSTATMIFRIHGHHFCEQPWVGI